MAAFRRLDIVDIYWKQPFHLVEHFTDCLEVFFAKSSEIVAMLFTDRICVFATRNWNKMATSSYAQRKAIGCD